MEGKKGLKRGLILSLAVIVSFVLGVLSPLDIGNRKDKNVQLFEEIYSVLKENWYYGDDEDMIQRAIESLYTQEDDPFTFILEPSSDVMDTEEGKGVGVAVKDYGGYLYIDEVFQGPNRTNLRVGDIIIEVDGTSLNNKTYNESIQLFANATSKANFDIKLLRNGAQKVVNVVVGDYADSVTVDLIAENEDYLAVKIHEFALTTSNEFAKYLGDYNTADNLIIDLRDNPGGYITSVINIASLLLPNNAPVMSVMDRDENSTTYYTSNNSHYIYDHIYILINDNSASGAEALTLCLMDNARTIDDLHVTVLGQKSYGKGSAQQDYELSNGYKIHCTYALWYSPNGININKTGIEPTSGYYLDRIDYESTFFTYSELEFEDQNDKVLNLQYQLKYLGYDNVRSHGYFDELTEEAVKDIQTKYGLESTGVLDVATYNIIKRAIFDANIKQNNDEFNYVVGLIGE